MTALIALARRWFAATFAPAPRCAGDDPADMGTAFGLDAITSIEPSGDLASRPAPASDRRFSPFEPRPPRRSVY